MIANNFEGRILELEPIGTSKNSLRITIDPRMELLSIVQYLSKYDSRYHLLTKYNFTYKSQIEDKFSAYKEHEAVKIFDSLSSGEEKSPTFSFNAPPEVMIYINDDFTLSKDILKENILIKRAGGEENLLRFINALHSFAVESKFREFLIDNYNFYQHIVSNTANKIESKDFIGMLENFYGVKQRGYTIILVPLFHEGGFGPSIENEDGTRYIYSIIGPVNVQDDLPDFGSTTHFDRLQQHEFSHSFVNPLTDKYSDEAKKYLELYKRIETEMKQQAYGGWKGALNEHIIRAITTRFAYLKSQRDGDDALTKERNKGFIYVDALLAKINEYEENRDKYPTFDSFYIELLSALNKFY